MIWNWLWELIAVMVKIIFDVHMCMHCNLFINMFIFVDLPDISLVTNKLRNVTVSKEETESSTEVNVRKDMSLSTVTQNRTWIGLNPNDIRPPVIIATEGRKGTPSSGYTTTDSNHCS